jgi:hypothetical protein
MNSIANNEAPRPSQISTRSAQRYARIAGFLFLITLVAGGFGEFYVPSKIIVSGNAAATANNIQASGWLFRLGFAAYLVEAVCDIGLTLILYALLVPVRKNVALLAAFFRLVSTATFATAELFYFAASLILGEPNYLKTFSPDQLKSLALLTLNLYGYGGGLFMVFYGVASILLGYLIFQSGYLPKFLGVLLALGGVGFVTRNFALVVAPAYASDILLLPMSITVLALTPWLLVKGIDIPRWQQKMAGSQVTL